jgi:signal transduction histidine kinase
MFWPAPGSFRSQAAIITAASLAVVGLAAFIVSNVIIRTEDTLRAEARQMCTTACQELALQYDERTTYGGNLQQLPEAAQDLSLQGISHTVLRAFDGMEGMLYFIKKDKLAGYSTSSDMPAQPNRPPPDNRRPRGPRQDFYRDLALRAAKSSEIITEDNQFENNYFVWAAMRTKSGEAVAITAKRISIAPNLVANTARWWLAGLVFLSLFGMLGIVSIWYMLRSGVTGINRGLQRLQENFAYRLPQIRGDFSEIAIAINGMADRRAALEEELRRQDRLAALGKVVSGVAHEVKNPLNSMKLTLQLLDRRLKKGVPVTHEIQEALHEIDRLDSIVSRLLAFGRPSIVNRQVQEIAPLVQQAIKMVQEPVGKKSVRILTQGFESALKADVDGPQIVQVLINLLLNAVDASPDSGCIRIEAESQDKSSRIRISDQGTGIPEEARVHVFDAYYTTKPNGSGLGLAVSREIVVNHGGILNFETGPEGTIFILELPIDRSQSL